MGFGSKRRSEKNSSMTCTSPSDWSNEYKDMRSLDDLLRCPICYDFYNIAMMVPGCSHNYCSLCIRKYLLFKKQCPTCTITVTDSMLRNNRVLDEIIAKFILIRSSLIGKWQGNRAELKVAKNIDAPSPKRLKAAKKTPCSSKIPMTLDKFFQSGRKTKQREMTDKDEVVFVETKPFSSHSKLSIKLKSEVDAKPFTELKPFAMFKSSPQSKAINNESKLSEMETFESILDEASSVSDSKLLAAMEISGMKSKPGEYSDESKPCLHPEPKPSTSEQLCERFSLPSGLKRTPLIRIVKPLEMSDSEDFVEDTLRIQTPKSSKKTQSKSQKISLKGKSVLGPSKSFQNSTTTSSATLLVHSPGHDKLNSSDVTSSLSQSSKSSLFLIKTQDDIKSGDTSHNIILGRPNSHSTTSRPTSNMTTPIKDKAKVVCPVCGTEISSGNINSHLDLCLTSGEKRQALRKKRKQPGVERRKPMLKLVYALLSEKDLRKKLKDDGLCTNGEKHVLIRRHQEFTLAYNAQCDSLHPKSAEELALEMGKNERLVSHLTSNPPQDQRLRIDRNSTQNDIQEAKFSYVKQHSQQFTELVKAARKTIGDKSKKSQMTTTTTVSSVESVDSEDKRGRDKPRTGIQSASSVDDMRADNVQCIQKVCSNKSIENEPIGHLETVTTPSGTVSVPLIGGRSDVNLHCLKYKDSETTTDIYVHESKKREPDIVKPESKIHTDIDSDPPEFPNSESENMADRSKAAENDLIGDSWPPLSQQSRPGSATDDSDSSSLLLGFL